MVPAAATCSPMVGIMGDSRAPWYFRDTCDMALGTTVMPTPRHRFLSRPHFLAQPRSSVDAATSAQPRCDCVSLFLILSGHPMAVKLWGLPALLPLPIRLPLHPSVILSVGLPGSLCLSHCCHFSGLLLLSLSSFVLRI